MKLTRFDDMVAAEETWRRIELEDSCCFFRTYDWLAAWQEHLGAASVKPGIVLVSDGRGSDLALLPLGIKRDGWGRGLVWLGGDVSTYHGPIITSHGFETLDAATIHSLISRLQAEVFDVDYVDLDRQPAYIGDHANPFARYRAERTNLQSHSTCLEGDWPAYYAGKRSGKTRSKERRRLAKLKEIGEVAFLTASTPDDIDALMDDLIREKSRQYREIGVEDLFADSRICKLFRETALRQGASGRVQLSAITLDGKPIAINYSVIHHRVFHGVFLCYVRNDVTNLGPGTILLHHIFQWCFANGIERFDFSLGDQDYKNHWCERTNPFFRSVWPVTRRGELYVQSVKLVLSLKTAIKSSPALSTVAKRLLDLKGRRLST